MSDFGEMENVVARKQGRCEYCYTAYTASRDYGDEGFTPGEGDMPERVKQLAGGQR